MAVRVFPEYDFLDVQGNGGIPRHVAWYVEIEEEGRTERYPADALFHKKLQCTDKESLDIKGTERVMGALTVEERRNARREGFLELPTLTPLGIKYFTNNATIISGQWLQLYCHNNLKDGDWVFGWGYRKHERLCIALTFNNTA